MFLVALWACTLLLGSVCVYLLPLSQVHTECKSQMESACTLGERRLSILPPSALQRSDAIRVGMWEVSISKCSIDHINGFHNHIKDLT